MSYLQTSTANPYGHRPWQTRLYTGFANYSYLKQPQNTILRGDLTMRPEIYKPPELAPAGVGAVTVVTGSGRVVSRTRRRRQLLGAIPTYYGLPASQMIRIGPIADGGPPFPGPMPVYGGPVRIPTGSPPVVPAPLPRPVPIVPPMLPPTIVPPVPTPVSSAPDGTVWMLPGTPATPGSPYMPAPPSQLPAPGVAPGTTAAVPTTPGSFMDWFTSQTLISGIPNGYLAAGAVFAIYFMGKRRGR